MVRLKGCAAPGDVEVLGGAENVREPREPELTPPPIRASADEAAATSGKASDKTIANALTMPRMCCVRFMSIPSIPPIAEPALTWAGLLKNEATARARGCGAASRG